MGSYDFLLAFAIAGAAFVTVFARRKGSSWRHVLGLILPLLGIAGFAGANAFLSGLDALLVGTALVLPALWFSLLRSRTAFAAPRAPVALPPEAEPDDPTAVLVRETDLADAAQEQRAFRGRTLRAVGPAVLLVGTGALLGRWSLALMGVAVLVASALINSFAMDPAGRAAAPPRARTLRLRPARLPVPRGTGPGGDELD